MRASALAGARAGRGIAALFLAPLLAVAIAAGCGSGTTGPADGGVDGGPDAGTDGGTDGGCVPSGTAPCPSTQPTTGSTCSPPGRRCQFGDDVRNRCRVEATCGTDGRWAVVLPNCAALAACADPLPDPCTPLGAECRRGASACLCSNCAGPCGGPGRYQCVASCPNIGSPCCPEGARCFVQCGQGGGRACSSGAWSATSGGLCPALRDGDGEGGER